jgi:hypothetical protein
MAEGAAWTALALAALLGFALRAGGLVLARALRADHPLVAWAAAVSQATLAAFVVLAVTSPGGAMPLAARIGGLVAGLAGFLLSGGRLLAGMAAGIAVLLVLGR